MISCRLPSYLSIAVAEMTTAVLANATAPAADAKEVKANDKTPVANARALKAGLPGSPGIGDF